MATNITGLDREDVARLLRLAEKDVEKLQRDLREVTAYSARLEQELEALSPECPSCHVYRSAAIAEVTRAHLRGSIRRAARRAGS